MMEEKIYNFLQEAGSIFYATPNANRALGMEKWLPDYHIISAQKSTSAKLLLKNGIKTFYLDKNVKNSGKLLSDIKVINYIKDNSGSKVANILTFKPSPMIEKICEKNGFKYLGNNSQINRAWENKVNFVKIMDTLGISNANSSVMLIQRDMGADSLDFSDGKKYVVQFARGYSGNSTFLINKQKDFDNIIENNVGRRIKISDYKEGDAYTFNVCIGEFGILISKPIFQITGFSEFNKNILGTCGNDYAFGKSLDSKILEKAHVNIRQICDILFQSGYRGILGFDFVISADEVNLIEINPRFIGSIPVFIRLQLSAGETPFLLLHILSFLNFNFNSIKIEKPEKNFEFSQVILRNNQLHSMKIKKTLAGGIYKLTAEGLTLKEEAYYAPDNMALDEFFIECVSEGEFIDPDMEYANIQMGYGIMETKNSFKREFLKVKSEVFKKIILE